MLKKFLLKLIRPPLSYAQAGEDRILNFLFIPMGINKITYIDIGANDPVVYNNTYLFYLKGSSGVLIEPDPEFNKALKRARPRDKVIQAAISDSASGEADFYIFNEPAINTLSKEEAAVREKSGKYHIREVRRIQLLTIEKIIKDHLNDTVPHVISLDVEGEDFAVLNAFPFGKYPVPVWIIETCSYSETHIKPKITSIIGLMKNKGYFVYADSYINTVFVHAEWFYNYKT